MVNTPVLFETFVRVDYARQVWDAIKATQPKKLYFYSNKGRVEKEGEVERNNEIRSWVKEIDWDCELHTWFRDECVDVYTSLRGAITWLFENEKEGIILEDDCVPTPAFFSFCDQMIEKFREDKRVWYVSGDNFRNLNPSGYDYIFSRRHWMYGWASWADRWEKITWDDLHVKEMIDTGVCYQLYKTKAMGKSRERQILNTIGFVKETNCWDYAFGYIVDQNLGVGCFPTKQLVSNVGVIGTNHSSGQSLTENASAAYESDEYVITKEPPFVIADMEYDYQNRKASLRELSFKAKVKKFLQRICGY